jgi:hypothetical protein
MTSDQFTALLGRLDAVERANAARHAEVMHKLTKAEDAAQCANLTAEEVRTRLGQALGYYGVPPGEDD